MKNNDLDFIKDKFNNSGVNAPQDLDDIYILNEISDNKVISIKSKRKSKFALLSGIAVCLVGVILISIGTTAVMNNKGVVHQSSLVVSQSGGNVLNSFNNYKEVKLAVKNAINNSSSLGNNGYSNKGNLTVTSKDSTTSDIGSTSISSSNTYVQVDGVKEGAEVKTDGKYIYFINGDVIDIFKVNGKKSKQINKITSEKEKYISDIYLLDNYLISIETSYGYYGDFGAECYDSDTSADSSQPTTTVNVYDISNPKKIKEKSSFMQSGSYCSSRLINNQFYLVTNSYQNEKKITIPYVNVNDKKSDLSAKSIYTIDNPSDSVFLVLSRINVNNVENDYESKAVLGIANDIYCNKDNLYVTGNVYVKNDTATSDEATTNQVNSNINNFNWSVNNPDTQIVKVDIKNGLNFVATATVKGCINNQYSLDEYEDNLRVATTIYSDTNSKKDTNNLYVLDSSLNELGTIKGFAKGENIEAVQYVDGYAYVITYEETDPLFVMDLQNPENPKILGSVKINGFSSMLVPIDSNTILGIGYNDDENGIKLALFDVSNKAKPKVLDSKVIENADSTVQYSPKALVCNTQRDNYTIPVTFWEDDYADSKGGEVTFSINEGKIKIENTYKSDKLEYGEHCVFVNDNIYILDSCSPNEIDCTNYS